MGKPRNSTPGVPVRREIGERVADGFDWALCPCDLDRNVDPSCHAAGECMRLDEDTLGDEEGDYYTPNE